MSRRRRRTGSGLRPGRPSTSIQEMPRPGNSAATWGATQPGREEGSQPRSGSAAPAPISTRLRRSGRAQEPLDARAQLGLVQLADGRVLERPARVGVGERRAATDSVEAGHGAVAVDADRHPPAAAAEQVADGLPIVTQVHREEAHASTVARVDAVDHVLLLDAVAPFAEPERDHRGPVEEVADADRPLLAHLAGGDPSRVLRAGKRRRGAVVLGDVGVAFELAPGGRHRELGQGPARRLLVEPERGAALADPPHQGAGDGRGEDQADDDRVAVFHDPSSLPAAQASAAGSTTITPSSATARSTTVTKPNSRSIRTSLTISTANPAIAVTPEASTAVPVRE